MFKSGDRVLYRDDISLPAGTVIHINHYNDGSLDDYYVEWDDHKEDDLYLAGQLMPDGPSLGLTC
jgi:hypothetical protein